MSKRLVSLIFIIFQILILTACNLPAGGNPTVENDPPDIVFTSAAETTEAKLSPTIFPVTQKPTSTVIPVEDEPIHSPEPSLTSTPTEAPTPSEIPENIFFDDFSDTTGWYTHEDDRFGFKYTADGYHIYNNINMGLIWSIREQDYTGVALEVDGTRLEGSEDSYFGVVCNFADDGDNYYALVIGDNGFYGFGLMDNGEYEFVESGIDETGVIKKGQGETNRIRGVCNDNHFKIYANGELLLDAWNDTLEEGIIGLVVGNQRSDSGAEFRFNDFSVSWP
jgi:hypothetical protein